VDGVTITGSGGFGSPFFGTSAAAPHAAGIAALLLDCNASLTRTQLRDALLNKAVDLGPAGPDNDFGYGRLDALASATSAGCTAGGPTATATAIATRTPTPARLYGDANCDGDVSSVDAAVILQLVAGIIGSLNCPQNADVDRDGSVTAVDAAIILQYVAGLIDSLPP
jgi:subtilisin family serine protease